MAMASPGEEEDAQQRREEDVSCGEFESEVRPDESHECGSGVSVFHVLYYRIYERV
jgi:hypothetical protein